MIFVRLGKMVAESCRLLSFEQQREILHLCQLINLLWVGQNKLKLIEVKHLECILGYQLNHTQATKHSLLERLQSLKYYFQNDALRYHLLVLKSIHPRGLTLLSIFNGIRGAKIALHQLGIHLRVVVSIQTFGIKRRVLKRWWHNTGQTRLLVQIKDIKKLSNKKLESLIDKLSGFDFNIWHNSFMLG